MEQEKEPQKNGMDTFQVFEDEAIPLPLDVEGGKTKRRILMEATVLFAKRSYHAVSLSDIAQVVGIKTASLYNHFSSKEDLWEAVLEHTKELYILYHKYLDEETARANTFEEVLDIFFVEPRRMTNVFTCYAFALVLTHQFSSPLAGEIMNEIFLKWAVECNANIFNRCIEKGMVEPFDTQMAANLFSHAVLGAINASVHGLMGRPMPYNVDSTLASVQQAILCLAGRGGLPGPASRAT